MRDRVSVSPEILTMTTTRRRTASSLTLRWRSATGLLLENELSHVSDVQGKAVRGQKSELLLQIAC